jgi:hypothetical protein
MYTPPGTPENACELLLQVLRRYTSFEFYTPAGLYFGFYAQEYTSGSCDTSGSEYFLDL